MAELDDRGHEILDDSPVSLPLRFLRVDSVADDVRRFIREELSRVAASEGVESFEEADDFAVGDDFEPSSVYELDQEMLDYDYRNEGRDDGSSGSSHEGDPAEGARVLPSGQGPAGGEVRASDAERPVGKADEPRVAK